MFTSTAAMELSNPSADGKGSDSSNASCCLQARKPTSNTSEDTGTSKSDTHRAQHAAECKARKAAYSAKDRKAEDEHCHWDCFRGLVESAGFDKGRESLATKSTEKAKPDETKSDVQQAKEDGTGKAEEAAKARQSDSGKSTFLQSWKLLGRGSEFDGAQESTLDADKGRKSISSKAEAKATPDVTKSDAQQAKEVATGKADKVAGAAEHDYNKSVIQKAVDKSQGTSFSTRFMRPFKKSAEGKPDTSPI